MSILLAVMIWVLVNQSMISSKTVANIPVRVINIPAGKTIQDIQGNGLLTKRVTLTLFGNKAVLDELNSADLEVIIDAQNRSGEWLASINKRNLVSLNPEFDLTKGISRVSHSNIMIRLSKLVTEKVPVFITQPIGEAPKEYQFLDVWPYQLSLTVSGPEEVVKRLKSKGLRLTFDLNEISRSDLEGLQANQQQSKLDEVSFFVPDSWKKVQIPMLSDIPFEIDDPKAKQLRIDFARASLLSIKKPLSFSLFFPTDTLAIANPSNVSISNSNLINQVDGLPLFSGELFVKGVSPLFLQIVEEMLQIMIVVEPNADKRMLNWSVQFINPSLLEDRYVSLMMSDTAEEDVMQLQPQLREEYLRNRFRSYMNRFQLFQAEDKLLKLQIYLDKNQVVVKVPST